MKYHAPPVTLPQHHPYFRREILSSPLSFYHRLSSSSPSPSLSLSRSISKCLRFSVAESWSRLANATPTNSSRSPRIRIGSAKHAGRLASPSTTTTTSSHRREHFLGRRWVTLSREIVRASLIRRSRGPDTRRRRPGANRRRHHRELSYTDEKYCARTDDVWDSVKIQWFAVPHVRTQPCSSSAFHRSPLLTLAMWVGKGAEYLPCLPSAKHMLREKKIKKKDPIIKLRNIFRVM